MRTPPQRWGAQAPSHQLERPIENSDSIVFEEDRMEPWRSDHGVEVIGPGPSGGRTAAGQGSDSLRAGISRRGYSDRFRPSCPRSPTPEERSVLVPRHEFIGSSSMAELTGPSSVTGPQVHPWTRNATARLRAASPSSSIAAYAWKTCGTPGTTSRVTRTSSRAPRPARRRASLGVSPRDPD